jgi:hypothetical protein
MATTKTLYLLTTEEGTRETFTTIGALNKFAGIRATKQGIVDGEFENIQMVEDVPPTEEAVEAIEQAHKDHKDSVEVPTQETLDLNDKVEVVFVGDAPKAPVKEEDTATEELTNEDTDTEELTNEEDVPGDTQLDFPEVGEFEDDKEMGKYIKELSDDDLASWIELEGIEHKENDNPAINRMRMAMAIKQLHFPKAKSTGSTKKKSKYGHYSLEDLATMAIDNDVDVKDAKGDPRIERMYLIVALRNAGVIE